MNDEQLTALARLVEETKSRCDNMQKSIEGLTIHINHLEEQEQKLTDKVLKLQYQLNGVVA